MKTRRILLIEIKILKYCSEKLHRFILLEEIHYLINNIKYINSNLWFEVNHVNCTKLGSEQFFIFFFF